MTIDGNRAQAFPHGSSDSLDGLLLVDKPSGFTSHDVVAKFRSTFRFKKVGHGGTLDPAATGLLVLLLGRGTKLSDRVMGGDKTYEGTMKLGVTTHTQDADGEILEERDASQVTRDMLEAEMRRLTGDIMQTPPMVSAIKQNGVPLYKLARKGVEVERAARLIHIYDFRLLDFETPCARLSVRCTKGTYVRTLCADIGEALGCGAHLESLRRTRSGSLSLNDALPLADILRLSREELRARLISMHDVISKGL